MCIRDSFGTVQVPSGGEAIILMADRQTTGGYPKIAQIATVDLPLLAQYAPGRTLRFSLIELDEAQRLDGERERAFTQLLDALAPLRALLAALAGADGSYAAAARALSLIHI